MSFLPIQPRVIAKHEATNRVLVADATIEQAYLVHIAERREILDNFGPYLPGSFDVRTSGWLDCAVEDVRASVFAALVFPFDELREVVGEASGGSETVGLSLP